MNIDTKYSLDWIKNKYDQGDEMKFIYFWGNTEKGGEVTKACMSQWYGSPFTVNGVLYKTAEHWMMGKKALLFNDEEIFNKIIPSNKPGEVKALGREVRNYSEERWLAHRYAIVVEGNIHKFGQNPSLKEFLLNTGSRILVEASPVDQIWGIGMAQDHQDIADLHAWRGPNLLGFALMEARDYLRDQIS